MGTTGYIVVLADEMGIFVCATLWRPTPSTKGETCTCKRCIPRENKKMTRILTTTTFADYTARSDGGRGSRRATAAASDPGPRLSTVKRSTTAVKT